MQWGIIQNFMVHVNHPGVLQRYRSGPLRLGQLEISNELPGDAAAAGRGTALSTGRRDRGATHRSGDQVL